MGLAHEDLGQGVLSDPDVARILGRLGHGAGQLVLEPLAQAAGQIRVYRGPGPPGRADGRPGARPPAVGPAPAMSDHACHLPSMTGRCDTRGDSGAVATLDSPCPPKTDETTSRPPRSVVSEATESTPELLDALARLVPLLSSSAAPLTPAELAEIVASPATILFVARNGDGRVLGTLSLILFRARPACGPGSRTSWSTTRRRGSGWEPHWCATPSSGPERRERRPWT